MYTCKYIHKIFHTWRKSCYPFVISHAIVHIWIYIRQTNSTEEFKSGMHNIMKKVVCFWTTTIPSHWSYENSHAFKLRHKKWLFAPKLSRKANHKNISFKRKHISICLFHLAGNNFFSLIICYEKIITTSKIFLFK